MTLILASRSASRAKLLHNAGYAFTQVEPPFNDAAQPQLNHHRQPEHLAQDLALAKAQSLLNTQAWDPSAQTLILAADTIVEAPNGDLLGQPPDHAHAQAMLRSLTNNTHRVHTAAVLINPITSYAWQSCDTALVTLGQVTDHQLNQYLLSEHWQGKAGGYNLHELQSSWPFNVEGDPTTVVGLPMKMLAERLRCFRLENTPLACKEQ